MHIIVTDSCVQWWHSTSDWCLILVVVLWSGCQQGACKAPKTVVHNGGVASDTVYDYVASKINASEAAVLMAISQFAAGPRCWLSACESFVTDTFQLPVVARTLNSSCTARWIHGQSTRFTCQESQCHNELVEILWVVIWYAPPLNSSKYRAWYALITN